LTKTSIVKDREIAMIAIYLKTHNCVFLRLRGNGRINSKSIKEGALILWMVGWRAQGINFFPRK
jgi:hypothetical protein